VKRITVPDPLDHGHQAIQLGARGIWSLAGSRTSPRAPSKGRRTEIVLKDLWRGLRDGGVWFLVVCGAPLLATVYVILVQYDMITHINASLLSHQ